MAVLKTYPYPKFLLTFQRKARDGVEYTTQPEWEVL